MMVKWFKCDENLPRDGQKVIIYYGDISVATFIKGISEEERQMMMCGEIDDPDIGVYSVGDGFHYVKKSKLYDGADEHGNNLKPYRWSGDGPMNWFGQDVTHWMTLPKSPMVQSL